MRVDYDGFKRMLSGSVAIIREKCDELSHLDAAIGDGDHGVTMLRAMEKINTVMESHPTGRIADLLNEIGMELLNIDGGATGPLLGSLFLGMADGAVDQEELDAELFAVIFERGLVSIEQQTKARVGDKTLMDALIPAVESLRASAQQGKEIPEMLALAADAAWKGAESTKNFPAHFGRAKFQGDRTLGHPDPGSISTAYIFKGMHDGLTG
jgi:phosphoenolpyruvate---glycerone phosphotransferase subunit DhaL